MILFAVFMISCGTVKKNKQKSSEATESELNISKNKTTDSKETNTIREFEPMDFTKPMIINGDSIWNGKTKIINNYIETKTIEKDTSSAKVKVEKKEDSKEVERDNTWVIIGIASGFFIMLFLMFLVTMFMISKKIDKFIPK